MTNDIDLLIDSDFYWLLVTGSVKFGNHGKPVGIKTTFSRVFNGPLKSENVNSASSSNFAGDICSQV